MHPFIHIGRLQFPSYGLMMAIAFVVAIIISYYRTKKAGLDPDILLNIAIIGLIAGIASAWLLFIFVTYPIKQIVESITSGSFYVFKNGGLVFYGGVIGGALAAYIYLKIKKQRVGDYAAVIVPSIPLAHAIGRVGCFLAGCCYGKCVDTPISVIYKNPIGGAPTGVPVFPIQLVESACNVLVFIILLIYVGKNLKKGSVIFLYMILYGIERFVLEYFRYDEIRGIFLGLSTSQWISIAMIVFGAIGMILTLKKERRSGAQSPLSDEAKSAIAESANEGADKASEQFKLDTVKKHLSSLDLCALAGVCPMNKSDLKTDAIANAINDSTTADELSLAISRALNEQFSTNSVTAESCLDTAKSILDELKAK